MQGSFMAGAGSDLQETHAGQVLEHTVLGSKETMGGGHMYICVCWWVCHAVAIRQSMLQGSIDCRRVTHAMQKRAYLGLVQHIGLVSASRHRWCGVVVG
jgi:hypothetical protein